MAKRKNNKKKRRSGRSQAQSSSMGRWFEKQMVQVERLERVGEYEAAFELLLTVEKRYPRHLDVLKTLISISIEMNNLPAVVTYSQRLYPLETGDERATTLNNLMASSIELLLTGLACKAASILLADHPDFYLISSAQTILENVQPRLFESFTQIDLISERLNGDQAKMLDFMAEHDRMRFFADTWDSKQTILHCRLLLKIVPGFTPALNNMSLIYFKSGEIQKAIETTQETLTQQSDNFHALSNLTRYSFLIGDMDTARTCAIKLKDSENNIPDRWLKQAEAFAYLGDHEGVRDAYLEGEEFRNSYLNANSHDNLKSPLFLHLAAAAYYRLGDESKAWALWQEALQIDPSFIIAKTNFAERAKAPHERDAGWYWPFDYWFAGSFQAFLAKFLSRNPDAGAEKKFIQRLLKRYPQFPLLLPHILDRADPSARKMLLSLIEVEPRAAFLQALLSFGLSKAGTDAQRMRALHFLSQHHPHMLPPDRLASAWLQGEWQDVVLVGFHISREVGNTILDDQTYKLYLRAHEYLQEPQNLERAEELFMQVIKKYPDFPPAYNQLSVVYELQDRYGEYRTLVKQTHQRFPDYLFARVAVARLALEDGQIQEVRALLNPLLQRKKLNTTEFRILAQTEILYALAVKRKQIARTWLTLWEQIEPEHPDLPHWKVDLER